MATIVVTIGGVDKTSLVKKETLEIDDTLNARNSCSFDMVDESANYRPSVGQVVVITSDGTKVFAGTIDNIVEQKLTKNNDALYYNIDCVDYNQICDRYTVPAAYENQTLQAIVHDIVDNYLSGESITYTNVETGPTISKAVFVYNTVTEAFNDLSDLTGYDWYIDYNKDLHFFARESNTAPAEISDANDNFISIAVTKSREQYRNRQYLRAGYDITSSRTESFKGDGENQTWVLKFPVSVVPSAVDVNGVAKTIGIRGVESGKDFYWSKNQKEITQDDSGTKLTSSDTLNVTYQGFYPIIVRTDREDAITDRKTVEGGNGIYENIEEDSSIESQNTAKEKSQALLRRYGTILQHVDIITDASGFKAGQLVKIDVSAHGLNGTYLIQSVKINDFAKVGLRYSIRALSGENIGGWVNFFKKMVAAGKQYVIRENEVLIRITQFIDTVTASDTLIVTSASPESRVGYALVGFSEVGV